MRIAVETITPKKATDWLSKYNKKNRPIRQAHIDYLAGTIERGEWVLNGESIKFNCLDELIDGQHRLAAIAKAGKSVQTYVVRGLQAPAFDTIDGNRPRTIADRFSRKGEINCKMLAAAIGAMQWIESRTKTGSKPVRLSPQQAFDVLAAHPGLRDSAHFVNATGLRKILMASVSTALHYLCGAKDKALADAFFGAVASGENLAKGNPAYHLREYLLANRTTKAVLNQQTVAIITIKCWNAARAKQTMRLLRYAAGESFPTIN